MAEDRLFTDGHKGFNLNKFDNKNHGNVMKRKLKSN